MMMLTVKTLSQMMRPSLAKRTAREEPQEKEKRLRQKATPASVPVHSAHKPSFMHGENGLMLFS